MIHLCLRERRNGGTLEVHGVHQVGGVIDMHRREAGRKEYVADFVGRTEIRARFGDDACRAVGGNETSAYHPLLVDTPRADAHG